MERRKQLSTCVRKCSPRRCKSVSQSHSISPEVHESFNSNYSDGKENSCSICKKLNSRILELELEVVNLKKCVTLLNSQLHDAHEKAEDISFIKNESVIILGDKLDAMTGMLEEKSAQKKNEIVNCNTSFVKDDLIMVETPQEVCKNVKDTLMVAESHLAEISDCMKGMKNVFILGEEANKDIL